MVMQILNDYKRMIGDGTSSVDKIWVQVWEILKVIVPNNSCVWFMLDHMKSILPVIHVEGLSGS